ncbi:MAG: hypothetical protein UT24_C0022G0009 [Candidatus Woesebacteria bacterium GW2011_GWB1_39_12]|uniref:Uncharacterized protein n=1 Tax=Candidatus Woesebacteria bacterium GW2011_GWB1_39_12 TaxID=1618574 RepID=A0A0G0M6X4_9BACT|nr:MAG: hypothetical protein UT24_C0022G0009 [Candidatus Woesebacteria bacterium GW2011_GWB1_39_12]
MDIDNVGDLKEFLKDIPDETPICLMDEFRGKNRIRTYNICDVIYGYGFDFGGEIDIMPTLEEAKKDYEDTWMDEEDEDEEEDTLEDTIGEAVKKFLCFSSRLLNCFESLIDEESDQDE